MTPRPFAATAVLAVLFLAGLASTAKAQDKDQAFIDGMKSLKDGQWEEAVTKLAAAIRLNPNETPPRNVGGNRFAGAIGIPVGDPYLPYLFKGRALSKLEGRCAEALDAWDESRKQGVAQRDLARLKEMDDGAATCRTKGFLSGEDLSREVGQAGRVLARARNEYDNAKTLAAKSSYGLPPRFLANEPELVVVDNLLKGAEKTRRLDEIKQATDRAEAVAKASATMSGTIRATTAERAELTSAGDAIKSAADAKAEADKLSSSVGRIKPSDALTASIREANQFLDRAREALSNAEYRRSVTLATSATTGFEKVKRELKANADEAVRLDVMAVQQRGKGVLKTIDEEIRTLDSAIANQGLPDGVGPQALDLLRAARTAAQKNLDTAVQSTNLAAANAAAGDLTSVRTRLGTLARTLSAKGLRLAGLVVPDTLSAAATHFFAAEHKQVLDILTPEVVGPMDPALRLHAHLFRAAALFARFEYSGRTETDLLSEARRAVQACREIDPLFQPDPAGFSPRFRAFFGQSLPAQ